MRKLGEALRSINKLSLPATILIASIIFSVSYYASQATKQNSIERQQRLELQAKKDQEDEVKLQQAYDSLYKSQCVSEAEQSAQDLYKANCTYDCKEGQFYVANYDSAYDRCLQRKGLK